MKTFSGTVWFGWCRPMEPKVLCFALVLGAAMFAAGCGKGNSAGSSTATPQATESNPSPAAPQAVANAQPAPAANAAAAEPNLQKLNHALILYKAQNHRSPTTFEEFAASANIQIPPPPPGKKYALDGSGFIVLMNNSTQ
jgi:hypothetical protein